MHTAPTTPVKLFNTLTRSVDLFNPISPGRVGIYCCGPTVYNFQHIGNLRTYVFEDLLARTLRFAGYEVKHVMNITDVGHLVSDADDGEDKMAVASRREKKSSQEIAEHYTQIFFEHCAWLNIIRPNVVCKATEHITQMVDLIGRLEKKGSAYCAGGNVYFDVTTFPEYGRLAKLDLESLKAGARIDVDQSKRNALDFALWFTKSKFENQELQWDSPWGRGYPGWHIECSAMAMNYLGESFDIHCGGIDHIPVHHTNEIAQSEAASGHQFARVWMHGGFLVTGKEKMAKSKGEFLTLDLLKEKGYDPTAYRLLCLTSHYRSELSWSWEALDGAANTLKRLKQSVLSLDPTAESNDPATDKERENSVLVEFTDAVCTDLAMPRALAVMHQTISDDKLSAAAKRRLLSRFDLVLGLGIDTWKKEAVEVPESVRRLADARQAARGNRNWDEADRLRKEIEQLGFVVKDSKDGYVLLPQG
jgi:cysteinyl-tRNA synthetase